MTNDYTSARAELRDKIDDIRFPMFVWQDPHGHLLSQPMTQEKIDEEGGIWFFTSTQTSLWACIAQRPQVNLAYVKADDNRFVSLAGTAERVVDRERIRAMWNSGAQAWFPAGPDDEHAVLIRVDPHSAEFWNTHDNKMEQMFKLAKAAITGEKPADTANDHQTVRL